MTMESKNCPQCGAPLPVNAPAGLCPRCVIAMNMAVQTEFTEEAGPHDTRVAKQQPPSPAELAGKFPNLEILELLGQGGMGAVYKARQKELDRIVALKILPPAVSEDPAFAERFSREARALARLNHPNIVTLYEFGRADGLYFFLMEFVDGVSLRQLLDTSRVSSREALAIVPQICDALQYAHDQGIVHRDIKPENILMDRRGRVKVADFGLAKLVSVAHGGDGDTGMESPVNGQAGKPALQGEALTDAGKIMGTPQYMAPEQKERPLEVDHRADIYALGVVFYQMLTGELPSQRIEPPSKKVLIDVRLDEIVLRALEKDPERRYGQASVLKTQVESVASSMEETRASEQTGEASVPPAKGSANRFEDNSPKPKLLWITLVTLGLGALSNLVLGSWVLAYKLGFLESLVLCLPINAFMVWKIWRSLHPVAASDRTSTPISRRFGWLPIAGVLTIVALIFAGVFLAGRAKDTEQIRVNLEKELREQISELLAEKRMTFSRMQFEYSTVLPRAFVTFTGLEEHRNKTNAMPMTGALHLAFDTRGTCVVSGRGDLQEVQRTWPIRELNLISWPRRVGPTEDEQFHTDDSFAAVVVALDSLNRPSKNRFLDLDSGKVVAPPKDYFEWSRMRREQWLRENGIDLMVLGNNLQPWWLLTPVDNPIQLAGISIETWRRGIEPEPTATTPVKGEELQFPDLNLGLISFHLKHHRPTHPEHTFLFQTANGRRGMLRISGTIVEGIETLAGVKIEFKALANDKPILFEPVQIESARIEPSESAPRTDWFTVLLGSVLIVAIGLYWLLIRSKKTKADAQGARTPSPRLIHALRSVAIAVAIVLVLRTFVVAPFYALSDAASPEVPKGSWVLVYKLGRSFKPGDVVVFKSGGRDKLGRVLDQYYRAGSNEGIVIIERDHTEVLHRDVVGKVVFNTRASRASAQEPLNVWSDLPGNTMASGLDSGSDHGASPRTDFSAELPDGSFVELVAIQHTGGPAPRQPTGSTNRIDFWNPDGTKHINNLGWSFSPSAVSPQRIPGWGYRGFVVHWNGPAANNTRLMAWEVDGNPEASGIYNVNSPRDESAEKWLGILQGFPSDQNTAKLRFALASGPYLEGPPEKKNLIWSRSDKTPWGSYSIGEIFDHNGNAAITLTHNLKGCDYRLYTEFSKLPDIPKSVVGGLIWEMQEESRRDQRYKRTYGRLVKSGAGSSQSMEVWEFPGIPAREAMAKRPSIYFEVRPVQWVEFDNVALHPEKFVPVNIRVGNEQEARATKANPIISEPVR